MKLPKARTENLLEQNLAQETLIYDLTIDKAFNLNETLSVVYKACGQNLTFDDLRRKHGFTDEFIFLALDELKRNNLLAEEYDSPFAGYNRREVIRKVGLATMFALPLISGLVAPKAINAASGQENSVNASDVGESCSTFNNRKGNGELCRASFCISTNSGESCCTGSEAGSPDIIRPGTSIDNTDPDSQDFKYVVITPGQTPPTCASSYRCCDGSQSSYGTCNYEEQEVASNGWILARLRCNCSCP